MLILNLQGSPHMPNMLTHVYTLHITISSHKTHHTLHVEYFTLHTIHVCQPDVKREEKVVTGNPNALRDSAKGLPYQERNNLSLVSRKILTPPSAECTLQS